MTDKERQEVIDKIKSGEFDKIPYGNTGTIAFYDIENDLYYNHGGQMLKNPEDYDEWLDDGCYPDRDY